MSGNLRLATAADSKAILEIYAPFITDTAITFETEVPSVSEFASRIEAITAKYPFLVYEADGEIAGYAYASMHRERAAYLYDVDVSIYVSPKYHGTGIAHRLYGCLFTLLDELGYKNAYAAYTQPNEKSGRFHRQFGFTLIGTHHKTGYKFGKWYDVTWLEKTIAEHEDNLKTVMKINEIPPEYIERILNQYTDERS